MGSEQSSRLWKADRHPFSPSYEEASYDPGIKVVEAFDKVAPGSRGGRESKKTYWIHVHYSRISSSLMCSAVILILIGALRVKNKAGAALISD